MANEKTKRCYAHDYLSPCIYLVTAVVEGRRPLLGQVAGTAERARIEPGEVGWAVRREIEKIPARWPQVRVMQHQIMPDHVHLVLYVTERPPDRWPLGNIVATWKQACGRVYSDICDLKTATPNNPSCDLKAATPNNPSNGGSLGEAAFARQARGAYHRSPYRPLFRKGFNDSILTGQDQLHHIMAYVRDNPRRLLVKQQHRDLFHIHRGLIIKGISFDAMGNLTFLSLPMVVVHCRRKWSEKEQPAFYDHFLMQAQQGAVLIGAFISPREKAIQHAAEAKHLPLIQLLDNGLSDLYKPYGDAFYAMAEGRLLQLAPFPYCSTTHTITRKQCSRLNLLAESIACK